MSRTLLAPIGRIPIGVATIGGQQVEVMAHPEWLMYLAQNLRRMVLTTADGLDGLEGQTPPADLGAREALRAIDELRQELAVLRSDADMLRKALEEPGAELQALRAVDDLTRRVQQIEDRLL